MLKFLGPHYLQTLQWIWFIYDVEYGIFGTVTDLEFLEFFVMISMDLFRFWHRIKKCFRIEKSDFGILLFLLPSRWNSCKFDTKSFQRQIGHLKHIVICFYDRGVFKWFFNTGLSLIHVNGCGF